MSDNFCGMVLASSAEMHTMDTLTLETKKITSTQLMRDAATAAFKAVNEWSKLFEKCKVLVLCGGGNNGGDGYVLASMFAAEMHEVSVFSACEKIKSPDTLHYYNMLVVQNNVTVLDTDALFSAIGTADLIIDAVYGTGFHGNLPSGIKNLFKAVAQSGAKKVAIDIPSGVHCDDGTVSEDCFTADFTVTFEFLKPAHVTYPAKRHCGVKKVVSIGFPDSVRKTAHTEHIYITKNKSPVRALARDEESHKGDFGKMLSVCGSRTMTGAPYFAAMGALRSGIGLLYVACDEYSHPILATKLAEPIFHIYDGCDELFHSVGDLKKYDVVLHGCGSGKNSANITKRLIDECHSLLVLDADALRNVAARPWILRGKKGTVILTPHAGEMAALCGKTVTEVQSDRLRTACEFAKKSGCVTVLKGAGTIIAMPDGRYAVNSTGNAGMAKGGSGDILAGMIAARCAKSRDVFAGVCAAVFAHGAAGDECRRKMSERSMLPTDLIDFIV